jgi:hypothetical protein
MELYDMILWSFGSINDGNSQPINVTSPPGDGYNSYIVNGVTYAKGEYWLDEQQPLPQQIKLYPRIASKELTSILMGKFR